MKVTRSEATKKEKHGINLWVYPTGQEEAGVVYIEVAEGHLEEFFHRRCTFVYYVLEGEGTFYLNGEPTPVQATDLVVIPPMTKIYYLGTMKLTLTTIPSWTEKDEVHVRFISKPTPKI
ncbi:MAG: cupin domain-containing protein [Patescibacteria group bacterium]